MEKVYVDGEGVENVAVGIVRQAKKDFVRGARILYGILHYIPTQKELYADKDHIGLSNMESVKQMYDVWRFVRDDPYQFFPDEKQVIDTWKEDAITDYYSSTYLDSAEWLYKNNPPMRSIHDLDNDQVIEIMANDKMAELYIESRNYILNLENGKKLLRDLNLKAFNRLRRNS